MTAGGRSQSHLVAVVDANAQHRTQVAASLLSFYRTVEYPDAAHAVAGLRLARPDVILVGEQVPPCGGFKFVSALRRQNATASRPIILIVGDDKPSVLAAVQECGATTHLVKPYWRSTLIKTISGLVNTAVERKWEDLPATQRRALKGTVEVFNNISDVIDRGEPIAYRVISDACTPLVRAVNKNDFKSILHGVKHHDNYSYAHSLRVATLLSLFGYTIGLPDHEQLVLASGGLLHDVGKMSIPHEVLNKPGRLSDSEWGVMRGHVLASVRYLRATAQLPSAIVTIAAQHHEKLDGSGYPRGLSGRQLNELARMASIVDVFGALTDRRIYKPPMEAETALKIMTEEMTGHLDGKLLRLFRDMLLDATLEREPEGATA